jgi:hypothetical protein
MKLVDEQRVRLPVVGRHALRNEKSKTETATIVE